MKGISSLISTRTESVSQEKSNDLNDNPVAEHASKGSKNMNKGYESDGPPMMSKGPKHTFGVKSAHNKRHQEQAKKAAELRKFKSDNKKRKGSVEGGELNMGEKEVSAANKKEKVDSPLEKRRTKAERQANRAEKRKKKADRLSKGTAAQKNRAARIRGRAERSKIKQSDGSRGEKLDAQQKSRDKQKSSQTDLDSETGKKYKSRRGLEKGGENESKTDLTKYAPKKDEEKKIKKYGGL